MTIGVSGCRGTRILIWVVLTSALLVTCADARPLQGTIYLGDGTDLFVEMKEGTFSEVLRFVKVNHSPRETVNLTKLGAAGDRIFVGTDHYVYCQKRTDEGYTNEETYRIGRAVNLWEVKLADGVVIHEVERMLDGFTGEGGTKVLRVDFGTAEKKGPDVERAGFRFWLDELAYQYDSPGSRRGKKDNFQVVSAAVLGALPTRIDDQQEYFTNLKALTQFVKETRNSDLVPFRDLLARKLLAIETARKAAGDEREKFEPLLSRYEALRAEVIQRTEGF